MNLVKKIIILNVLLAGWFSTSLQAGEEWIKFQSEKDGFAIELPSDPEHVAQSITVPKTDLKIQYDTFVSEPSDSVVYVTSVWKYPSEIDMTTPEVNLKDGFSGMLQALPGSEVVKMDISEVDGFKSLEFLVKNEDIYFQGKLILVYNTLYQVFTVYKESEESSMKKNYTHFISSFKLLKPEKNRTAENYSKVNV